MPAYVLSLRRSVVGLAACLLILFPLAAPSGAGSSADLEGRVVKHTLPNGLTLLILERHDAPVFSFHTHVDVGSSDEQVGATGLAHLFEHLAFMGTQTIGTTDYSAESRALDEVDKAFYELCAERQKGVAADSALVVRLDAAFGKAQEKADKYVVSEEFSRIVESNGGVGLNASTWVDFTWYYYSLPSNKVELWATLESDRMASPVLRRFYKERNVVMEERRMRTESDPQGRLEEDFQAIAFKAHPYRFPTIGHMSDLLALTRPVAEEFYRKYYGPASMAIAVVGDVRSDQVISIAERSFGKIPSRPKPPRVVTVEPPQLGERRVVLEDLSQPVVTIGYHRPGMNHPDNAVYEVLSDILGNGRTSRLYRSLVKEKKVASQVSVYSAYPGDKYPSVFFLQVLPAVNHGAEEVESAIYEEIERLTQAPVAEEELMKARRRARADLVRNLRSNSGMALRLAYYETIAGDYRELFRMTDRIQAVTADDVLRVAKECFRKQNRVVGLIVTAKK